MKKYWEYQGVLVEFDGSQKKYDKFIKDNDHLKGCEIDEAKQVDLKKEQNNRKIRSQRAAEYPSITDQLDSIMKWLVTETEFTVPAELKSLAGKCMSVKSKYPIEK